MYLIVTFLRNLSIIDFNSYLFIFFMIYDHVIFFRCWIIGLTQLVFFFVNQYIYSDDL